MDSWGRKLIWRRSDFKRISLTDWPSTRISPFWGSWKRGIKLSKVRRIVRPWRLEPSGFIGRRHGFPVLGGVEQLGNHLVTVDCYAPGMPKQGFGHGANALRIETGRQQKLQRLGPLIVAPSRHFIQLSGRFSPLRMSPQRLAQFRRQNKL